MELESEINKIDKQIFKEKFFNPTKGNLYYQEVIGEILVYIKERPEMFYDIIVGCDSSSEKSPNFPVVVAILRKGEGGRFFLKKVKYPKDFNKRFINWRNRILQEVLLSCDLALSLKKSFLEKFQGFNCQFKYIHADISENGQTKDMVKELTGLIRGNGFEPKIKPEACIASIVADRYS